MNDNLPEKKINIAGHHRQLLPDPPAGFDVVILSDLFHFNNSHEALVDSVNALLSADLGARVYISVSFVTITWMHSRDL